jgi:hypothetical protein
MISALLLTGILLASGAQPAAKVAPAAVNPKLSLTAITNASITPASITFSATDPSNVPVVGGSSGAVISFTTTGTLLGSWNLKVSAPANFSSCPTIPIGAATVSCSSVTGGSGGACGGSSALSTAGVQMASGTEGLLVATNYTVNLNFTLQDSWKYIASSSCSLTLTYTITAN